MSSVYVHLARADTEDLVRRDAGVDDTGCRLTSTVLDDDQATEQRMGKALRKLFIGDSA